MNELRSLTRTDIVAMQKVSRLKLVNSLSGFKSANLVGTVSQDGLENLAIFSSVIHVGSSPPLIGCLLRPTTVPRHTYNNIQQNSGWYTINHVNQDIFKQAHQASGNYREEISEFEYCKLNSWYSEHCPAPYVQEARIRLGVQLVEEHLLEANQTRLLIGSIEEIWLPKDLLNDDGTVNIEKAGTVAISGVDTYHTTKKLDKLHYVRVDKNLRRTEE